jgi:hypothetical protein
MIRELTQDETLMVSGGNANSNYEGGINHTSNSSSWSHLSKNSPNYIYGGPGTADCANGVFGALASNFGKPGKMAIGVAKVAGQCLSDHGNNSGALGGDHSSNSVNGQCHW